MGCDLEVLLEKERNQRAVGFVVADCQDMTADIEDGEGIGPKSHADCLVVRAQVGHPMPRSNARRTKQTLLKGRAKPIAYRDGALIGLTCANARRQTKQERNSEEYS